MLMMFGYVARRAKVIRSEDVSVINSLLINITFPAFIFVNTHSMPFTSSMAVAPVVGFISEAVILGLAYLISRALKLDRATTGALMLVATFGNTGFLGYPVINAAFGGNKHAGLTAVMFDEFGMALPLYTIGVAIATTFAGTKADWRSFLGFMRTPIFPATVIALATRTIYIPSVIVKTLSLAGAATIPLAMISIGMSLSTKSVGKYPIPLIAATLLKMVVLPVLMFYLLPFAGVHGIVKDTVLIQSALPAAVFTGVISERYGGDYEFSAAAIFVMTLLCVVTTPLLVHLLR